MGLPLEPLAFPLEPLAVPVLDPLAPEYEPVPADPELSLPLDAPLAPLCAPVVPPDDPLRAPVDEPLAAPLVTAGATENAWPPHPMSKAPAKALSREVPVRFAIIVPPSTRTSARSRGNLVLAMYRKYACGAAGTNR